MRPTASAAAPRDGRSRGDGMRFSFWRRRSAGPTAEGTGDVNEQPLAACSAGCRATVVCVDCPAHDALRLRSLGVFEGARVGVVDTRSGILLDVRGARLALDLGIARFITVRLGVA